MRKTTENQGDTRALGDCFSPRSKVKDLAVEQRSLSQTFFHQETPMKPSQLPNRLSHPPPRRVLPVQTPELCCRDRMGSHWQHPYSPGAIHSSGFVSSSPPNIGSSVTRPHFMHKDRLGPPNHFVQPSRLVPSNQTNIGIPNVPQPISSDQQPGSVCTFLFPGVTNQPLSSHIGRDQVTESKVTLSSSGSKTVTTQRQRSIKAQSSDVGYCIPTIQLHRPSMGVMSPPFNTRAPKEVHPQPPSHSERWYPAISQWPLQGYQIPPKTQSSDSSRLSITHSSVASCQNQQGEQTPLSEKSTPAVDLVILSHKRRSEYEYCSENAKKTCPQGANSDKTDAAKPLVCTSLATQPSLKHSSVSELPHKTADSHLRTDQACGQSTCSELSSTVRLSQSWSKSSSLKECTKKVASQGAQQAVINSCQNHVLKLKEMKSSLKPNEESVKKRSDEKDKKDKSSTLLSPEIHQKDTSSSTQSELGSHHFGHIASSSSGLPVKTTSKSNQVGEHRKLSSSTPKPNSKLNSGSLNSRTGERNKTSRVRRPAVIAYDTDDLFTPDPVTYVVGPGNKTAKPKIDGETTKTPVTERDCYSSTATNSSTPVTESSCEKPQNSKVTGPLHEVSSSVHNLPVSFPTVTLKRVKLENLMSLSPKGPQKDPKNSLITSSSRQLKDDKNISLFCNKVSSSTIETNTAASDQTSASSCSQSLPLERPASKGDKKQVNEEEPIDVELDLGLSFTLDLDLTQSSHSSEEEQLLSFQEMMECVPKPPDTQEKGIISDPNTPGRLSCQSKTQVLPSTTKPATYKNNLDQILKEINTNKKSKEIERQLLNACEEDLLRIAEYEAAEEQQEEGISTEQQEFLQRYSLMSTAIKEVPPGEEVFNLEKFGQIFNQDTLQLRQCMVNPQGTAQKTLLWSSPAQLRLHVNIGLFQEAYNSSSPCPAQVTRFLFKMMSVHNERMISEKLLQALCDIAFTAAYQIVKNESQQFKVWVPSLADVTLVLMNMGVPFVKLFPFENLQPPFTEGTLLEDVYIKSDSPSSNKEQIAFPEHNCNNILKYLSYCMGLCPRAYSDNELLLLLTVVSHIGLETQLILESSVALDPLLCKIVNNIRDWDTLLPKICQALSDLTDDHHNMCLLVHLLPDNIRGKELRRHLSLCMISKLLDGSCTYRPLETEFQLSDLKPYLPRMQPSSLLRNMLSSSGRNQKDKEEDTLDQQSYYLCYSLLTLANEASNFQFFRAHQKEQLLFLSSELETHVKCDIRESEKCLYRSKVKDLVARIYTKWQMLLQRTRPLHGKLYDYWQPADTLVSSQEEQEDEDDAMIEDGTVMGDEENEEEVGETTSAEENEAAVVPNEEKEDGRMEPEHDGKLDEALGNLEENDTSKTEEANELESVNCLNQGMPEMEPEVLKETEAADEQIDAHNMERTDEETETEAREASHQAEAELVS